MEASRVLEELLDLLQLLDGLVATSDVTEVHLHVGVAVQLGLRLTEAQHAAAALHGVHDHDEEADEQQDRKELEQQRKPHRFFLLVDRELDVRVGELRGELVRVLRGERHRVHRAVLQLAVDAVVLILQRRVAHVAVGQLRLELVECQLLGPAPAA